VYFPESPEKDPVTWMWYVAPSFDLQVMLELTPEHPSLLLPVADTKKEQQSLARKRGCSM
jgi:hypothetical protein